ncbi:uncharacterized protein LOC144098952 [Amblyomma americanum]
MFVAAVACALVWVVLSLPPRPGRKNTTQNTFCCPEEAAQLFAVIDREHSPCKDFFAHVCKNAIKEGVVKEDVTKDILPLCRELAAGVAPVRSASCCHDCHEPAHRTGSSGGVALPVIHQPSGSRLVRTEDSLEPVPDVQRRVLLPAEFFHKATCRGGIVGALDIQCAERILHY